MSTFYLRSSTSDLPVPPVPPGGAFSNSMTQTSQVAGTAISFGFSGVPGTRIGYFHTPLGVPNNATWEAGNRTVKVRVFSSTVVPAMLTPGSVVLVLREERVDAAGAVLESQSPSAPVDISAGGNFVVTLPAPSWAAGGTSNRVRLSMTVTVTNPLITQVTLFTDPANSRLETPLVVSPPPPTTTVWISPIPDDWDVDADWSAGVPDVGKEALFNGTGNGACTITPGSVCRKWTATSGSACAFTSAVGANLGIGADGANLAGGSVAALTIDVDCEGPFVCTIPFSSARRIGAGAATFTFNLHDDVSITGPSFARTDTEQGGIGNVAIVGTGTLTINTTTPAQMILNVAGSYTVATACIIDGGVFINSLGSLTGNATAIGDNAAPFDGYTLRSTGSHSGTITLQDGADVYDFSGTTKPAVAVTGSGVSDLPATFTYTTINVSSGAATCQFTGIDPAKYANLTATAGTVTDGAGGVVCTGSISCSPGAVWTAGAGIIRFTGGAAHGLTLNGQSVERVEARGGTTTLTLTGATLRGLFCFTGATLNLNAQTINLADMTDGGFVVEAGSVLTGRAGTTIACRYGDMQGTTGTPLDLDNATPFTIVATDTLVARNATMRNNVAGGVGGVAIDSVDLGGNTNWTSTTAAAATGNPFAHDIIVMPR